LRWRRRTSNPVRMRKELIEKSKFLSLVLRHDPGSIGVALDAQGWVDVGALLRAAAERGTALSRDELLEIVATNPKRRFDLDVTGNRIRANQGHSVEVDLALPPVVPPELLYHGTARIHLDSIRQGGLQRGQRQHVHLSADPDTARAVGQRHGSPVVLRVASGRWHRAGAIFYLAKNGVWLTEQVPAEYLEIDGEGQGAELR